MTAYWYLVVSVSIHFPTLSDVLTSESDYTDLRPIILTIILCTTAFGKGGFSVKHRKQSFSSQIKEGG